MSRIAGNDVRNMSASIHDILTNREVIAIDQGSAGRQARRVWQSGQQEVWSRKLADAKTTFRWMDAGILKTPSRIRDLWLHAQVKAAGPAYSTAVAGHGTVLLRIR